MKMVVYLMKLSNILAILTILQFAYLIAIVIGIETISTVEHFSLEHEDMSFVIHLMSWFIVRAIENINKDKNGTK